MPVSTESLLAIILSEKRISAAEMNFAGDTMQVASLGDIPVPAGVFDANQIGDGEALGRAISEFIVQKRIAARKAVMVLPEGSSVTQLIKLPPMPEEDMLGAVRSVAERYAMFAEHTISAACTTIEETQEEGNPRLSVLLAASRSANVERCQEAARVANLDLVSVEAPAVAAARAYRERFVSSEVVALAVVGEVKADVMIFDGGVLRLCYSANAGLPEQSTEGDWFSPPPEQFDPFTPPPQLYSELTHCFRFFQNQFPNRGVDRLIIAADHPNAEMIASHLAAQLQLPVELGRPFYDLHLPTSVDDSAAATTRTLTLALFRGSSIAGLSEDGHAFPINLLPPSRAAWAPARRVIKIGALFMALALLGSIIWTVSLNHRIGRERDKLATVESQIAALQPELDYLRAMKATEQALKTGIERETARIAKEQAVRWSQILVDTAARLPRDMWLTQLSSPDDKRINLTGIATNRETIPPAIQSLSTSPYLTHVVLGSLTKDDVYAPGRTVIRFQIRADLMRGLQPPSGALPAPAAPAAQPQEATQ